jgi:hypothetical protein
MIARFFRVFLKATLQTWRESFGRQAECTVPEVIIKVIIFEVAVALHGKEEKRQRRYETQDTR